MMLSAIILVCRAYGSSPSLMALSVSSSLYFLRCFLALADNIRFVTFLKVLLVVLASIISTIRNVYWSPRPLSIRSTT